jgi:hypothetical protein
MQDEQLWVLAGWQALHQLHGARVEDLNGVVVAGADQQPAMVLCERDPARTLADLDGPDDFELGAVDAEARR